MEIHVSRRRSSNHHLGNHRGFNERQRYIAVARLRVNNSGVRNTHYKKGQVLELLTDLKFWLVFFIAFLGMIANGPISTFTPIIINSFGFNTLNSLLLVIPAGFIGGTYQLLGPYLAYKYSNSGVRAWIVFVAQMITTLAAILLVALPLDATGGLLFACYILPAIGGGYAVLMGLQIANIAGYTKRSIASSGLYIGYCLGMLLVLHCRLEAHFYWVLTIIQVILLDHLCIRRKMRQDMCLVLSQLW
jgi:hypothetical protein